jgi:hypothetical protein
MEEGNRELNERKIKRIQRDIMAGIDVLQYFPILVQEKKGKKPEDDILLIKDGQHRFYVARKMQKPVHYIVVSNPLSLHAIAKINSNTERWKYKDFINCYTQQDNEHYKALHDFQQKSGLPTTICLHLLARGTISDSGFAATEVFQSGQFKVEKLEEAQRVIDMCRKFQKFPHWKDRKFIVAICKILQAGKCDIDELVEKFEKDPQQLEKQHGYKEYLSNLEIIYNKNARHRRVIY